MVFYSKQDAWLVILLSVAVVAQIGAGGTLVISGPERWPGVILLATSAFIVWVMRSTYYVVGPTTLLIRSGPFRWTIALDEIEAIAPTHNPLSSPALSLDRLWIRYRRGGKKRTIMISPLDKVAFIEAVRAKSDGLVVETRPVTRR